MVSVMNINKLNLVGSKTREELLDDFKQTKENPYWVICRVPIILIGFIYADNYSSHLDSNKSNVSLLILAIYLFIEITMVISDLKKKIHILYEIEKMRGDNESNES